MRYGAILTAMAVMLFVACKSTTPPPTPTSNQPPPVQYEQGPQAPSVGPRVFTPGIAVSPIQHSPWTTTTNDPSVTLQAQQPVSITTTNAIAFIANGLMATTNLDNWLMNARSFGATGNGSTDDTASIQNALNLIHSSGGGTLVIPIGNFVVDSLVMYTNTSILGTRGKSVLKLKTGGYFILSVNPGALGPSDPTNNQRNIVIQGVTFSGQSLSGVVDPFRHALNLNGASYVTVRDCDFIGIQGDGIYLGSGNVAGHETHNEHILIENCTFDGVNHNNRNGVSIIDGTDVTIRKCLFTRLTAPGQPGCVDIEPDGNGFERIAHITISDNTIIDCHGDFGFSMSVGNIAAPPQDIAIRNNFFSSTNSIYSSHIFAQTVYPPITTNTAPMNIVIEGNVLHQAGIWPIRVKWLRGVTISRNDAVGTIHWQIGDETTATNTTMNVLFEHNTMKNAGSNNGMMQVGQVDGLTVIDNLFDTQISTGGEATGMITLYGNPVTTSATRLNFAWNRFLVGPYTNLSAVVYASGCTVDTNAFNFVLNSVSAPINTARSGLNIMSPNIELTGGQYPTLGLGDASLLWISPNVLRVNGTFQATNGIVANVGKPAAEQIEIQSFSGEPGLGLGETILSRNGANVLDLNGDLHLTNLWAQSDNVKLGKIGANYGLAMGGAVLDQINPYELTMEGNLVVKTNLTVANQLTVGFVKPTNASPSTLVETDGTGTLVSIANAKGLLLNDGAGAFNYSTNLTLGSLTLEGDGSAVALQLPDANAVRNLNTGAGGALYFDSEIFYFRDPNDSFHQGFKIDGNATAGESRLLLWDVTAGTLKRVSFGTNDSAGAGYKVLRVSN